jgi:hypothetical protein
MYRRIEIDHRQIQIMPDPTSSEPQINRVGRWYKRFKIIDDGDLHNRPSEEREDDMYAFFLNCHYLKDWVKKDPALASLGDVEQLINGCPELCICADLCNGNKHFKLTKKPRSDLSPQRGPKRVALDIHVGSPEPLVIQVKYEIETTAGTRDAFKIATECMNAWAHFLGIKVEDF